MSSYEEIRRGDAERQRERRQVLKEMIDDSFQEADITVPPTATWKVRVEIAVAAGALRRDKCAVVFEAEEPPMMDTNIDYRRLFQDAVDIAKGVMQYPPFPERIYQGKIIITNSGPRFERREDVGGT
jgi:hypothetical protein